MQELMSELIRRIDQFQHGNREAVLGAPVQDLADELRRLVRMVHDDGVPSTESTHDEVRQVLGWLHWCRYLALPPGEDQDEFHAAFAQFSHLVHTHPEKIPVQIREHLAGTTAGPPPDSEAPSGSETPSDSETPPD